MCVRLLQAYESLYVCWLHVRVAEPGAYPLLTKLALTCAAGLHPHRSHVTPDLHSPMPAAGQLLLQEAAFALQCLHLSLC